MLKIAGIQRNLSEFAYWVVVLAAILSTILVLRREFFSNTPTAQILEPQQVIENIWRGALEVGIRSGSLDAPVQIIEFADFECPSCADYELTLQSLRDQYREDQVAFYFVHYPLSYHASAVSAARAAECANLQGQFEAMRSILFREQRAFGSEPWIDFAKEARVPNIEQFESCMTEAQLIDRVEQGRRVGDALGIPGTPTFVVNGWMLRRPPSLEDFERIVSNVLNGRMPMAELD